MLLESPAFWLTIFYIFCALAGGFVVTVYLFLNRKTFRSEETESTEVGYEEDSTGHVLKTGPNRDFTGGDMPEAAPHMDPTGNLNSGPM